MFAAQRAARRLPSPIVHPVCWPDLSLPTVVSALPGAPALVGGGLSMSGLGTVVADFLADESGATAAEYALIVAGIAVAIVASLNAIGTAISTTFGTAGAN
jgi:pilus assembly protein Flp/PilA